MKFYDQMKLLYLETDASNVGLVGGLLQTRWGISCPRNEVPDNNMLSPITFTSKSLSTVERRNSNIEREALAILYGLEKFYQYCFVMEVGIITDHKPLVAIFKKKKDLATLSQITMHTTQNSPMQRKNSIQNR